MRRLLSRFFSDRSGATSIEYALIAVGISIVVVAVVTGIGTNLNAKYSSVNSALP